MKLIFALSLIALGAFPVAWAGQVRRFQPADKSVVTADVRTSADLCRGTSISDCWEGFNEVGQAWVGDVNGDGIDELMVFPGYGWSGSGGDWHFILQKRGARWRSLYPEGFQVFDARFDILPKIRDGYHDLRIEVDWCLKWNGTRYMEYAPSDYRALSPAWFDSSDYEQAEIFWSQRYAGLKKFKLDPRWFRVPATGFGASQNATAQDSRTGATFLAVHKAGVWELRDGKAFLLLPRPAYRGADDLKIQGDWLLIYAEPWGHGHLDRVEVARYNLRTAELTTVDFQSYHQ